MSHPGDGAGLLLQLLVGACPAAPQSSEGDAVAASLPLPAALGDVAGLFGAGKGAKRWPGSTLCGETKKITAAERETSH